MKIMGLIFLIAMAVAWAQTVGTKVAGPQNQWQGVPIQNGIGTQIVGNGINVVRIPRTLTGSDYVQAGDCHGLTVAHPPSAGWIFALTNPASMPTTFPQSCEPFIHNYGPGSLTVNGATFGDGSVQQVIASGGSLRINWNGSSLFWDLE